VGHRSAFIVLRLWFSVLGSLHIVAFHTSYFTIMQITTLTTARLTLRPLSEADATDLFPCMSDAETMRHWHTPPHANLADTAAMIREMTRLPEACWWALCPADSGKACGFIGYHGNQGIPGMGYLLQRDMWGQGYVPEAMQAVLSHGFTVLGLERAELWIREANRASQRVAEKAGFTRRGSLGSGQLIYGLTAEAWSHGKLPRNGQRCYALEPVLPVRSVAETSAFYRDVLGFAVEFLYGDPPTHAGVFLGEWTNQGARIQFSQVESDEPITHAGWLYLFVSGDIDGLYARLQANGVQIVEEIASEPWGMREFTIADCNGHQLRFGQKIN
jgi:RimJ/RimL family protein N-acetyltransferase/uncharacterized glyoxalase superfamily protein PhnB